MFKKQSTWPPDNETWRSRVAREESEESVEPASCRWHPDRNATAEVSTDGSVGPCRLLPVCNECAAQMAAGL